MTYLNRIKKEKLSVIQIQKDLKHMLESKEWTSSFCHCEKDQMRSYSESLSLLKRRVHLSEISYMSSIYSEDLALVLIKSCLEDNISHIARFLISDDSSLELMGMMLDGNVGYIVNKDKSVEEVSSIIISVRKNDIPCQNSSGFMVDYIYPIKLS